MFTIDLLKGQGIPAKSRPESIAIVAVAFAVPVITAIVMFGFYLSDRIVMSVQEQRIANYEANIGKLSDAAELQKSFEREKKAIRSCLSEVSSTIGRHTQWSGILATLVRNMPDSMVLTRLEAKKRSVKRKVPKKNEPGKMIDVSVPVRTLQMSISGSPDYNCDKAVKDFRNRLRFSSLLGPKLEDIRVSQKSDTLEGRDVVSYEIDCIFKPEL
jgi:Tfp pilus assembly protein PilN